MFYKNDPLDDLWQINSKITEKEIPWLLSPESVLFGLFVHDMTHNQIVCIDGLYTCCSYRKDEHSDRLIYIKDSRVITDEGALFILQRPLNIPSIQLRRLNRLKSLCIFLSVKTKYLILPKWTDDQSLNLIFFVLMIVVNKSVPRDIVFIYNSTKLMQIKNLLIC